MMATDFFNEYAHASGISGISGMRPEDVAKPVECFVIITSEVSSLQQALKDLQKAARSRAKPQAAEQQRTECSRKALYPPGAHQEFLAAHSSRLLPRTPAEAVRLIGCG
ncbi:hypothetical protein NDU88_001676 [Pleurodeles waltl]|uniref:Uncharacterized protein n=1 Tax=Pleurodeles waltl TaxID=8319 RepID=A0AAV7Q6T3_PLEWA|nr:hypothetical protein NDU88_001676 [Pleurodeles waltl]